MHIKKPNISMMEKAAFIAVVVANTIDNDLLSYECYFIYYNRYKKFA